MKLLNTNVSFQNLYLKQDVKIGLIAIIAIHNTKNGPALGGCRFVNYDSIDEATLDAMNLAKAMTYKSAMAGLPLGGGKSVIISHAAIKDRKQIFEVFGDWVHTLNGHYITASDSGTTEDDMKVVSSRTQYVTSINNNNEPTDDTAYMTACGVIRAMEAAVVLKLNKNNLEGVHIAVQGMGNVGYLLSKMLVEKGARVTATDINKNLLLQRVNELKLETVDVTDITKIKCDVFSPCALGGVINDVVIDHLQASIICGAANNQLHDIYIDKKLHDKKILFIPDYAANAGGVICAAAQAKVISKEDACLKVNRIYDHVMQIADLSNMTDTPPQAIANRLAEEKFS